MKIKLLAFLLTISTVLAEQKALIVSINGGSNAGPPNLSMLELQLKDGWTVVCATPISNVRYNYTSYIIYIMEKKETK